MKNKNKIIISLLLVATLTAGTLSATACNGKKSDTVSVTYNLKYDDQTRDVSVAAGGKAKDWKPLRDGYIVEGWYTDENCTKAYDFNSEVNKSVTLYAKWITAPGNCEVTFDYNYVGRTSGVKLAVKQYDTVKEKDVPEITRVGMVLDGWFTDKEGTKPWNFETDKVTENITLYAKYSYDGSVKRDENGKPIFGNEETGEPTKVILSPSIGWGPETRLFPELIDKFNAEYEGKIRVSYENWDGNQATHALRFQQTYQMCTGVTNYHNVADVYALAGLDFDTDYWYEGVSKDSVVRGQFMSIPIAAHAAYVIYNKDFMTKHNGENELPHDYASLSALLGKAYEEEIKTNGSFKTFVTNSGWMFSEGTSNVAFMQNDSELYNYDGVRHFENRWLNSDESWTHAVNAIENMYGLLGANGKDKGAIISAANNDDAVIDAVTTGNAMMGIVNFPDKRIEVMQSGALGIMPISGLFATGDTVNRNAIPVNTMGFHFYAKATDVTNTELAAAAVFADYISKNSAIVGLEGYFPCRKSAVEEMFADYSDDESVQLLSKIGDPENLRVNDGNLVGKNFIYPLSYDQLLMPILEGDGQDLETKLKRMRNLLYECLY